jgi:hypothetical protein
MTFGGVKRMATRHGLEGAGSGHQAVGYCCVFLAGCYVAAIILLVGYLITLMFR